jgi:polygalacturonase
VKKLSFQDDLAKPTGSSLVGYTQGSASAVPRTIQDKEREAVSVKDFGAKGDGVTDDTAKLQSAINYAATTGAKIFFPLGTYIINAPLLVHGHNKFPIYLYGEGNGSIIKTISTAADDTIIKIKGSASNENYITFSNLSFVATNADGQSCFKCTYDKTEADHWDGNAPFRIKNCSMFCKGYNVDYTDCQWSGNSYIKECNCRGGGLIKVKVDPTKYWAGGAYPHAFSNLVIEDIHFSAIGGWPKDSFMYLADNYLEVDKDLAIGTGLAIAESVSEWRTF